MVSNFIAHGAAAYDGYMGRWSRRLAPLFLNFAGIAAGERVLDVGCGTGSLSLAICASADVASVDAIDFEADFVRALQARGTDPRITARQADACALPFEAGHFDRALSLLVLHFVPDPAQAAAEMRRVLRPGGVAAATVWDTYGGMPSQRIFWDTIAALVPAAAERRAAASFRPVTQPGELRALFEQAGFREVTDTLLTIRMDFSNFEDYWRPLLTGQGTIQAFLDSLPAATARRVEEAVRNAYCCERPDGPRSFASVAWAVRGIAPEG